MDEENKKLFEKKEGAPPAEADPNAAKKESSLSKLGNAQKDYTEKSLSRTTATVRDIDGSNKANVKGWLDARIGQLEADISDLKEQLGIAKATEQAPSPAKLLPLPVVNENGIVITDEEARADPSNSSSSPFSRGATLDSLTRGLTHFLGIKNPSNPDIEDLDNEESWRNKTDDGPDPWTKVKFQRLNRAHKLLRTQRN